MFRWAPYTFVRILFFLVAGIILGIYYPDLLSTHYAWIILCTLVVLYVVCFVLWHFIFFYRFNPGVIGLTGIFLSGYLLTLYHSEARRPEHLVHLSDTVRYFKAVVTGYPEEKRSSWKYEAVVTDVYTNRWERKEGKIILYFSKTDFP